MTFSSVIYVSSGIILYGLRDGVQCPSKICVWQGLWESDRIMTLQQRGTVCPSDLVFGKYMHLHGLLQCDLCILRHYVVWVKR